MLVSLLVELVNFHDHPIWLTLARVVHEDEHGLFLFGDAALASRITIVTLNVIHDEEFGGFALEGQFCVGLFLSFGLLGGEFGLRLLFFLRHRLKV